MDENEKLILLLQLAALPLAEYYLTDHWIQFSRAYKKAHPNCCYCGMSREESRQVFGQDLHVHHLHYETKGQESWDDVQSVCKKDHEKIHEEIRSLPYDVRFNGDDYYGYY